MRFIEKENVLNFIKEKNYDIRESGNARWIDQKCTPDVLTIISDCILDLIYDKGDDFEFNSKDVWNNPYTDENISKMFKKPSVMNAKAQNEYDKFFSQPLELLAYSGVLNKSKKGRYNYYTVSNKDILTYLALREMNSLIFINAYCEKVLKDSGIFDVFELFFENPTKENFINMKNTFIDFTIKNTPINKPLEPRRIFTKIINPLAFDRRKQGTERGHLSENIITYDMLMYNRENFRDMYNSKPKDITRQDHTFAKPLSIYNEYSISKAVKMVKIYNKEYNDGRSEVDLHSHNEKATQIHHIFTKESYPQIADYYENLIALTPTQHYNYAHVDGNTTLISKEFQYICVMAKIGTIKNSYEEQKGLYEFYKMCTVLQIGLNNDVYINIAYLDFDSVISNVNMDYNR